VITLDRPDLRRVLEGGSAGDPQRGRAVAPLVQFIGGRRIKESEHIRRGTNGSLEPVEILGLGRTTAVYADAQGRFP